MNSKRSYLESLNAGRQRRPYASLEDLNRSLETLDQRIGESREGSPRREIRSGPAQPHGVHHQPYQSIARDLERVRVQEDGVSAFSTIAGELRSLRDELNQQLKLRAEMEAQRKPGGRAEPAGAARNAGMIGADFERLSGAIQSLAEKADDRSVNKLRLEIEQVKAGLQTLAREETLLSVDRRFDAFDRRFEQFAEQITDVRQETPGPELIAVAERLEEISEAVNKLPESLSLRSLEEKVRTLAAALDHFISQQGAGGAATFSLIEERLDEISRAIVATTVAAQSSEVDPEPFQRIEARISALAKQIEEIAEDRPNEAVIERLDLLSGRVDEMAGRAALPDEAIDKLARQIAFIAEKIDEAQRPPEPAEALSGLEQRLETLSSAIERRQGEALDQGNLMLRELERRLDEVAEKIDRRQPGEGLDGEGIASLIDARFSALAQTLGSRAAESESTAAISGIETRLEDISARLDASAEKLAGIDPDLIRNLEAQVTALSAHLAKPGAPLPEFEDIGPRLAEIERSIADNRESVLEAARQAAEQATRSLAQAQAEPAAVSGLAQEIKALEKLTRRSDERNGKTFEAIHDTLLKIVDRLASLETETIAASFREQASEGPRKLSIEETPSIEPEHPVASDEEDMDELIAAAGRSETTIPQRSPAEAASEAAIAAAGAERQEAAPAKRSRSMFSGLTRAFSRKAAEEPALAGSVAAEAPVETAPAVDLDAPLDPKLANRPLEPGSGAPDLGAIMKRVRDERGQPVRHSETDAAKSDFIAAARRAAQAAAAEAEAAKRGSDLKGPVKALRIGDLLKSRRKTILMATTGIMIALGGLQLGKTFMSDDSQSAPAKAVAAKPAANAASLKATGKAEKPAQVATKSPATQADKPTAAQAGTPAKIAAEKPARMAEPQQLPAAKPALASDMTGAIKRPQSAGGKAAIVQASLQAEPKGLTDAAQADGKAATQAAEAPASGMEKPKIVVPAEAGPAALREAASAGDAAALFEVGSRYADARGVAGDKAEAAVWYQKAAELGFAPAQFRLGSFYEKGIGVERDTAKARDWYLKAADQGNATAMHNLAVLHAMGAAGSSDNKAAARWFAKAAEFGVKDSQFNLGILAAKGVGMKQSLEESYKWFALVAEAGDKDAAAKRDEIAASLRPEQLERARAAAELWKPKPLDAKANTVEIPVAWKENQAPAANLDLNKAVENIQLILAKNGYDAGQPDGVMGARTKSAIMAFQKDNGMTPTGKVDEELVHALLERK